jgi:gluconolactonase
MKTPVYLLLLASALLSGATWAQAPASSTAQDGPAIVRLDPAFTALVDPNAQVVRVASGFGFTEGPLWVPARTGRQVDKSLGRGGYLLFVDVPGNVIWKYSPQDDTQSVFMYRAAFLGPDIWRWGGMNGNGYPAADPRYERFAQIGPDALILDRQGRLVMTTFTGRSIDRIEPDGTRTRLAGSYDHKQFNGTNDLVLARDGSIYFTDTFGGLRLRAKDPRRGQDINAVYRWKDGQVTQVVSDMNNVNGLAFSPDQKVLYVNASTDNYVNCFDVLPDGSLTNERLFIDLRGHKEMGVSDGMKVDTLGNVYESGPGGVWLITPEGRHIGTIHAPERVINMAFGDADKKTLYMAAHTGVYKVRVKVPGI